jgi:hypothetical protein
MKIIILLATILLGTAAQANIVKQCTITITHSDCSFFCNSEAESRAKECAKESCEYESSINGGNGECSITQSRSSSYVTSYDAVRHFVGFASAREK